MFMLVTTQTLAWLRCCNSDGWLAWGFRETGYTHTHFPLSESPREPIRPFATETHSSSSEITDFTFSTRLGRHFHPVYLKIVKAG